METTGIELKVQRIRARVSQGVVARRMGLHRATVARYEGLASVPPQIVEEYLRAVTMSGDVADKQEGAVA